MLTQLDTNIYPENIREEVAGFIDRMQKTRVLVNEFINAKYLSRMFSEIGYEDMGSAINTISAISSGSAPMSDFKYFMDTVMPELARVGVQLEGRALDGIKEGFNYGGERYEEVMESIRSLMVDGLTPYEADDIVFKAFGIIGCGTAGCHG